MRVDLSVLVVGGSGKTGRRVVQRLNDRGVSVRIGSPRSAPPFDWQKQETWYAALEGVDRVYIAHPDVTQAGASEQIRTFARLATSSGARRLVLLSGRENPLLQSIEDAVTNSGADWTILRPGWFSQNFSEGFLLDAVLAGEIALPVGNGKEAFVDVDDIAEVAVAALLDGGHIGQTYNLSGPRLLSFADVAAELSYATGRTISYVPLDLAAFRVSLLEQGLPGSLADGYAEIEQGRNAFVADDFERVTGRTATDFADFAKAAAATGVWNVSR
ncbi:NmrA family transcriptional regulator [Ralstonia solanacearum]|uniref:hypothetical protein n=1 Tax=Ralstonia solanacearum TaxID=305 RepID=UPI00018172DE|nr:hypothetical protein [Ralstonia solanacearum]MDC6176155.1 NmrA family transcriptional regulator [Ralstonia solanacearum]MDC6239525.1 NmrA family transcriptional regulator [Ralstonia solanacearum]TYZ55439.1 NmrA family transcriptional regulator [Ralstonia solanacearum]